MEQQLAAGLGEGEVAELVQDQEVEAAQQVRGAALTIDAAGLVEDFQKMLRNRKPDLLDAWLHRAEQGLLSSFAHGLHADRGAIIAAIEEPWSNGQTEGHINRLKMLKRQMYGRAKLDLLRAKMMIA